MIILYYSSSDTIPKPKQTPIMSELPNKYLEQHLEPSREEDNKEQAQSYEQLDNPLAVVEYKDAGTVEIKTPDLEVTYTYESRNEYDELRKVLKSFTLTNPHTGSKLSLEDILSSDYRIIFIPRASEIGETTSMYDGLTKEFKITDDLAKVKGILKLLHEIGHEVSEQKLSDDDKLEIGEILGTFHSKNENEIDSKQLEMILKDERDAWAFALGKIKPFLNDSNLRKENVLKYIHGEMALGAYSAKIKKQLKKN